MDYMHSVSLEIVNNKRIVLLQLRRRQSTRRGRGWLGVDKADNSVRLGVSEYRRIFNHGS